MLDELAKSTSQWLKGTGPESEIVISSRVRFARNIDDIPFSHWGNEKNKEEVLDRFKKTTNKSDYFKNWYLLQMQDITDIDRQFLVERHVMSREHMVELQGKALFLDPEQRSSIMINEEDHLRIQVITSGFDLKSCHETINEIDDKLSKTLNFAYSTSFGYLTACPTNTGTGMRASVMLHLPALVLSKEVSRILETIVKLRFAIRGLYGEGSEASGNFFQISNQFTLGRTEEDIIEDIERVTNQIIFREKALRERLIKDNKTLLSDKIWRAYGVLKNAYVITSDETIKLLSLVRLGRDLGIIKGLSTEDLNRLFISTQPAHLQKIENKKLSANERDVKRAELVRSALV